VILIVSQMNPVLILTFKFQDPFKNYLPSMTGSYKWSLSSRFFYKKSICISLQSECILHVMPTSTEKCRSLHIYHTTPVPSDIIYSDNSLPTVFSAHVLEIPCIPYSESYVCCLGNSKESIQFLGPVTFCSIQNIYGEL
jgi:hypothetical protein